MKHDSSHAWRSSFGLFILWQELSCLQHELQRHITILEELNFALHEGLIFISCLVIHFRDKLDVGLSASDVNLSLHQLYQTLHYQVLEQLSVLRSILTLSWDDLCLWVFVDLLNESVDGLHLLNTSGILISWALYLELDIILCDPVLVVVSY